MSEIIPILVVFGVLAFVVAVRRRQSGPRGLRPRPGHGAAFIAPPAANPPALRLLPLPGDIGLVAAREFRERVRGRVFRIGTLLVLVIVSAAIVIPTLIGSKGDHPAGRRRRDR